MENKKQVGTYFGTDIIKPVNSAGICAKCKEKNVHYGIGNGSFTYWCNTCQKSLNSSDLLLDNK